MTVDLATLAIVLGWAAQSGAVVWWAATITTRLKHVEDWVAANNRIDARITEMEAQLTAISDTQQRILALLDHRN